MARTSFRPLINRFCSDVGREGLKKTELLTTVIRLLFHVTNATGEFIAQLILPSPPCFGCASWGAEHAQQVRPNRHGPRSLSLVSIENALENWAHNLHPIRSSTDPTPVRFVSRTRLSCKNLLSFLLSTAAATTANE